jgi:hypothetical protein
MSDSAAAATDLLSGFDDEARRYHAFARIGRVVSSIASHHAFEVELLPAPVVHANGSMTQYPLSLEGLADFLRHLNQVAFIDGSASASFASCRQGIAAEYAALMEARLHEATLRKQQAELDIAELRLTLMKGLPA